MNPPCQHNVPTVQRMPTQYEHEIYANRIPEWLPGWIAAVVIFVLALCALFVE